MMETDHTAAGNKLRDIAAAENISFPSAMNAEHQGHVDMFKGKTGADFDKAYMDMMVEGHTGMVDKFKEAIASNPTKR
jgi:putative membrane protein